MAKENELILYPTEDGKIKLDVKTDGDTVWLSQKQMCELFNRERSVITKHINNIFKDGELDKDTNVQKNAH